MIIDSLGQEAKTNLKTERAEFSVSADKARKFLHIAVRNLYSNPVLASVVEVSQNAHDEHVRRGIADKPFIVSIPTYLNPTFSVRDFGAGISPKFMLEGYTQALESTKDADSEMSGGWGLGRLALLSLASTYNVTTYINGKERNYSIFESEKGIEILMTHERETKEQNGTLVSAPVPPDKVSQFRDACNRAFRYYETKPTIGGDSTFVINSPKVALKGDGWSIEEGSPATSAVCGIYHYPLQSNNIHGLTPIQQKLLGNVGLVMFFGPSELAPMANRQGLYYNDKTVSAIKKKLELIEISVVKEIQKKFDGCKSLYEAKLLWAEMFTGSTLTPINSIFKSSSKILWNNIVVDTNIVQELDKMGGKTPEGANAIQCTTFSRRWSRGGYGIGHEHGSTAFYISKTLTIFINDLPGNRGYINRAKSFLRENNKNNQGENSAIVLSFADDVAKKAFFLKTGFNEIDFQKISDVKVVKLEREKGALARAKTKIFEWKGTASYNRSQYGQHWDIAEIDLEEDEEGVYIGIERFMPVCKTAPGGKLDEVVRVVNFLKQEKFIPADFKLYGVRNNSEEFKEFEAAKDWITLDKLVENFLQNYKIPQEEIQAIADSEEYNAQLYHILGYGLFSYRQIDINQFANLKNPHLKDYFEKVCKLQANFYRKEKANFEKKHETFIKLGGSVTRNGVKPTYSLEQSKNELYKNIPIMKMIKPLANFGDIQTIDSFLGDGK